MRTAQPFRCPPRSLARFAIFCLTLAAPSTTATHAQPTTRPAVVAYVPNWVDLPTFAKSIDYAKLTHVNVAFENPRDDAGTMSFHAGDAALVTAAHAHQVKVLVSIGGGSASENKATQARYAALTTDAKRAPFVAKLADYVTAHDFDGLDVDLEGPAITAISYGPFVRDLSTALKAKGKLLTAAVSRGYGGEHIPDDALAAFDLIHVMAYDATGPWSPNRPGQHSSLEYARANVAYWLDARKVPRSHLVLGVPFYGYGFGDAYRKRDYPYADIVAAHAGAESADETGKTIWYNGVPTIRGKAKLAIDEHLAGVMIWSLDTDAAGDKSLLSAIDGVLRPPPHAGTP